MKNREIKLVEFESASIFLFASLYTITGDSKEFFLEHGDHFTYEETDVPSNMKLIEWAKSMGYDDMDSGYRLDNEKYDIDALKEAFIADDRLQQEDNPPLASTQAGRAFEFIENLGLDLPTYVELIDGESPGNDWRGVIIKGGKSIVEFQSFLSTRGVLVNFEIR